MSGQIAYRSCDVLFSELTFMIPDLNGNSVGIS